MAGFALEVLMAARERELGGLVVIERGALPFLAAMAGLALGPEAALMHVLALVAVDACVRQILVALAGVTEDALHGLVRPHELEIGLIVIEGLPLAPGRVAVAALALLSERSFVRLVLLVAAHARRRGVAEFLARGMAAVAPGCRMGAGQLEVAEGVVERLGIEEHDIRSAALVVGMTVLAFDALNIRTPAVETRLAVDVPGHVLVAVETEPALARFRERLVTVPALLLELGMALDHLARHDELLEQALCR